MSSPAFRRFSLLLLPRARVRVTLVRLPRNRSSSDAARPAGAAFLASWLCSHLGDLPPARPGTGAGRRSRRGAGCGRLFGVVFGLKGSGRARGEDRVGPSFGLTLSFLSTVPGVGLRVLLVCLGPGVTTCRCRGSAGDTPGRPFIYRAAVVTRCATNGNRGRFRARKWGPATVCGRYVSSAGGDCV